MRSRGEIEDKLAYFIQCHSDWSEPSGLLVPTEPDADQRRLIRTGLAAGITTLEWVLGKRHTC